MLGVVVSADVMALAACGGGVQAAGDYRRIQGRT